MSQVFSSDCTVRTTIDDVSIDELISRHGSPLFVYSEKTLRNRFRYMYQRMHSLYPNVVFAWSYKTNYNQALCAILHAEGALAEVVSDFEYEKAIKLGVRSADIIFNGPYKPFYFLKKAAATGARIHIDHLDEIDDLDKITHNLQTELSVGIRINMDTGMHGAWQRFGFNLESGQALAAVKQIIQGTKLLIVGLHAHIGSFVLNTDSYKTEVAKLVQFKYEVEENSAVKIEYLDIGGGFPTSHTQANSKRDRIPSWYEYTEKIAAALKASLRPGDQPQLIIEAGRAIIDEAGYLVTTVVAAKRLPHGQKAYITDAGINLLLKFWQKYNIAIDRDTSGIGEPSKIYGPLCMNSDALDDNIVLPPLERGTRLVIWPVGAYNNSQWMQFITYRPAMVLIGEHGEVDTIRQREDLSDIERRERLPERLKVKSMAV